MAESGSGVTVMKSSIYTGTGIVFDSNEANIQGGAVLATTKSVFVCTSCSFTNNKAEKGGAVYVEGASRTEINLSTFDRNTATENGAAYYIISSKTDPMSYIKTTTFTNNQVKNLGSIFLIEASLELDEITLENNLTQGHTSGIVVLMSEIILSNSKLSTQFGQNGG